MRGGKKWEGLSLSARKKTRALPPRAPCARGVHAPCVVFFLSFWPSWIWQRAISGYPGSLYRSLLPASRPISSCPVAHCSGCHFRTTALPHYRGHLSGARCQQRVVGDGWHRTVRELQDTGHAHAPRRPGYLYIAPTSPIHKESKYTPPLVLPRQPTRLQAPNGTAIV
jgi:hypothetical protein